MSKSRGKIAFIIEGESREYMLMKYIEKFFCFPSQFEIIKIPTGLNINMLYRKLEKDDFQTSVIGILIEHSTKIKEQLSGTKESDFSEIYLFFDLDIQAKKNDIDGFLPEINEMLRKFDNETENGKLYVSYPMVEAIRDICSETSCVGNNGCHVSIDSMGKYKKNSSLNTMFCDFKKYTNDTWSTILSVYINRFFCLISDHDVNKISYPKYKSEDITPLTIYEKECELIRKEQKVFILSGISQFIIDYFHWEKLKSMCDVYYLKCLTEQKTTTP